MKIEKRYQTTNCHSLFPAFSFMILIFFFSSSINLTIQYKVCYTLYLQCYNLKNILLEKRKPQQRQQEKKETTTVTTNVKETLKKEKKNHKQKNK